MTKENNFIYIEDIKIERKVSSYVVTLVMEDNHSFYIKDFEVDDIAEKNREDENFVAILLAYIEYARRCRNSGNDPRAKKLDPEIVSTAISEILKKYSLESVIDIFKDLKWHEIAQIIKSDNPIAEIDEVI